MLQEEIARLTGTLKFNVEARPLVAFEKRLGGVLVMLRELSTLANKKFTVKVALDSRSLRAQIERATKTKISLTNVDISQEALAHQGKRIQDYLNKTTIRLDNIRVDISKLVDQKRLIRTMMGQMAIKIPASVDLTKLERELRSELNAVGKRQKITVEAHLNATQFITKLRRALRHAQTQIGALKIRVADPQVRLKVDKQHLIDEIRAALAGSEFRIRINARDEDIRRRRNGGGGGGYGGADRGLSAMAGFARGALPGLGAAYALGQMNDINQKVTAATNSLEAVSGNEQNFNSNKNFLTNVSREMGLNYRDIAPQFSSIYQAASPSIGVKGTQDMFQGIMQFGTTHGISKEAMKGSLTALSQMFGKDKIQAEEARQQFAERMPNGMAMLAKAAGNSGQTKNGTVAEFSELMQSGKADPKKILPELGRLMKKASEDNQAYQKSLETTRVAQGRMNVAFEESVMVFAKGGFDKGMGSFFNTLADSMNRAHPLTEALGAAFEQLVKPVNALIRIIGHLGENWGMIADKMGMSKNALATLAAGIAIFMLPFGGFIVALGAAALALDDLLTYASGGKSVFGELVKDTPGAQQAVDNIKQSFTGIVDMLDKFLQKLAPVGEGLKGLTFNDMLLTTLKTLDVVLTNILNTMKLIEALTNGDGNAADAAASGINLTGGRTTYNRAKDYFGWGQGGGSEASGSGGSADSGPGFWSGLGDWLAAPASQRKSLAQHLTSSSSMPITSQGLAGSGAVDRGASPITIAPGAITLQVSVPAPEGTDPKQFADKFGPHIQELTKAAVRDAFGQARAQQAERQ